MEVSFNYLTVRQIGICLTEAGCSDPAFFVAKGKIEVKHTEVILVLASKWRKPYKRSYYRANCHPRI